MGRAVNTAFGSIWKVPGRSLPGTRQIAARSLPGSVQKEGRHKGGAPKNIHDFKTVSWFTIQIHTLFHTQLRRVNDLTGEYPISGHLYYRQHRRQSRHRRVMQSEYDLNEIGMESE